jgi:hypothetical protein
MVKLLTTLILISLALAVVLGQPNMSDEEANALTDEEKGRITSNSAFNASEAAAIEKFFEWEAKQNKIQRELKKQQKISTERTKHEKHHDPKIEFKRRPHQEE